MSDDDNEEPRASTSAGSPRPKRKKRRVSVEAAPIAPLAPAPASSGFTGGHLAGALVAGLVIGGMGGWAFRGSGAPADAGVAKDTATAVAQQPSARPATERPQQPPQPTGPVYIALADYSPREGPQHAKVTILEFSDFQ